jgi:glycosyltransferase involved in cell wall biosynthesis
MVKIKIINNKINMGLAQTRKIGFLNSIGKYIYFLDAGDKAKINELLKISRNHNEYIISFSGKTVVESGIYDPKANLFIYISKYTNTPSVK